MLTYLTSKGYIPLLIISSNSFKLSSSSVSILKILLPERQINKKIYTSFEILLNNLNINDWIISYIHWELLLIKELGFETNFKKSGFLDNLDNNYGIKNALKFNKSLFMDNFILPNRLKLPNSRNLLEDYYS